MDNSAKNWWSDLLFLTLSIGLFFACFLGSRHLSVPDEARYSEIPREMLALKDFITPHLDYVKYFEKPPLFYWLQTFSLRLFGLNEWAARIPNALMGLLGCLFTYAGGRLFFGRTAGIISSVILATSLMYYAMSHVVTLDMTVSVLLTGSLLSFLQGTRSEQHARYFFYCAYIFAALAMLTKGLIGIIFPTLIIAAWIIWLNEWRILKRCYLFTGIILFLIVATPWHILVQLKNPEFLWFYFIDQHFIRYFTMEAGRYEPFWFFLPMVVAGCFPWTVFIPQSVYHYLKHWRDRQHYKTEWFLLLWIVLILLFYSFSDSKLIPYILPVFPPIALLTGHYLARCCETTHDLKSLHIEFGLLPVFTLLFGIALVVLPSFYAPEHSNAPHIYLPIIAITWFLGSAWAWLSYRLHALKTAITVLAISTAISLSLLLKLVPDFDSSSVKPLATALKPLLQNHNEVICYHHYYQDLPFYIQQRISIVNWQNELEFGMHHQDTTAWMYDEATLWQHWQSPQQVFMIIPRDKYNALPTNQRQLLFIIKQTPDNLLVSNHPINS